MEQKAPDVTSTDKPLSDVHNRNRGGTGLRARVDRAIERALEDRRIVGTVVLVAKGGDIVYGRAAGFADREVGRPMQENGIFLLSSVAKPIVTAAALRLVENGRMGIGDSVRRWLPEFKPRLASGGVPEITIHHLLTHSAGLTYVFMEPSDGPYHRLRISSGFDRTDADLDEIANKQRDRAGSSVSVVPFLSTPSDWHAAGAGDVAMARGLWPQMVHRPRE